MAPDLNLRVIMRHARTITWKNTATNLPLGAAKKDIVWDLESQDCERAIRAYAIADTK
jgi:glutamate dehydrogenase/leucine dehydrogenase